MIRKIINKIQLISFKLLEFVKNHPLFEIKIVDDGFLMIGVIKVDEIDMRKLREGLKRLLSIMIYRKIDELTTRSRDYDDFFVNINVIMNYVMKQGRFSEQKNLGHHQISKKRLLTKDVYNFQEDFIENVMKIIIEKDDEYEIVEISLLEIKIM